MTRPRPKPSTLRPNLSWAAPAWLVPLAALAAVATFIPRARPRREERGDVIVQHLGVILLGIVALVALFALLQTLGVDIIKAVRTQLNLP